MRWTAARAACRGVGEKASHVLVSELLASINPFNGPKLRVHAVAMAMSFSDSRSAMAPGPWGAYGVRKAMLGRPGPSCGAARSGAMRKKVCMEHAFAPVDEYGEGEPADTAGAEAIAPGEIAGTVWSAIEAIPGDHRTVLVHVDGVLAADLVSPAGADVSWNPIPR
jgi:hypothetical protein